MDVRATSRGTGNVFTNVAILIFGVFACSTAVIMIKASGEHAVLLSSYRLFVGAVALTPLFVRDLRRHRDSFRLRDLRQSIVPGLLLAAHFISWIIAARMTTATNASLIVNLVPIAMPFFLVVLVREKLTRCELAGTAVAVVGLVLLSGADYHISRTYFWGDVLCLVSMLFFCCYLAFARLNRHVPTTWLYVVPLYYVAGIACFVVALFLVNPIKPYPAREVLLILGLGLVPTVMGHSTLTYALKHLRGQLVSIINMGQFVFAGVMAFIFFHEVPTWAFYVASGLLVAGAWVAIRGHEGQS